MTEFTLAPPEPLAAEGDLAFALERPQDGPLVDDLIDRAFGPGRFAKTAERLREGNRLRADLSVCAWDGVVLVGAARMWPVLVGETPAVFLGPFAVESAWRSRGLGAALIARAGALAQAHGERLTVLVGDMAYFGALGFERVPAGRVQMPGPVDPKRILWRPHREGALDGVGGKVRPAPRS